MNITVSDILNDLMNGYLNNELDRFVNADMTLIENKKSIIYLAINNALNRLYSQYRLKVDELWLAVTESRVDYPITKEHFLEEWTAPSYDKYLWKNEYRPWEDNLIQILQVIDHYGRILPLNAPNSPFSVYTPEYNILQIPFHPSGEYLVLNAGTSKEIHPSNPQLEDYEDRTHEMVYTIKYQCSHNKVSQDTDEIIIPDHLRETLLALIAYQIYNNMNTEVSLATANRIYQDCLNRLNEVTQESLIQPENSPMDNRFNNRGFI